MWFKPNKHLVLIVVSSAALAGFFACSNDRSDNTDYLTKASQTPVAQTEPEQIKLEILLKDEQAYQPASVYEKASTQTVASQPAASELVGAGYAGANCAAPGVAGGVDVPGAYGGYGAGFGPGFIPGLEGPWFGPGFPFFVSDFVPFWGDDGDDGDRRDRNRHDDDNANNDDDNANNDDDNAHNDDDGLKTHHKKAGR